MERFLMTQLEEWKSDADRKPLLLNGARQVGKTWLLKEFGHRFFENTAYANLDRNKGLQREFESGYDLAKIVGTIEIQTREKIIPEKTLIILDEIQECPAALTSLKYFREQMPELAIAAAGSLLGITIHEGSGFPVGKVHILNLYPMSFGEYMIGTGEESLYSVTNDADPERMKGFSAELTQQLKRYFVTGGMPEAVQTWIRTGDYEAVRKVQEDIIQSYKLDMSKHIEIRNLESVLSAWESIPRHLAQENKRFVFGHVRESARAKDFERAIIWLTQAGIAVKVPHVAKPAVPLSSYAEQSTFKLFLADVGLLGAMSDLDPDIVIDGNRLFEEFKGALTEQYVCQELLAACGLHPFYWTASGRARAEVDFAVQRRGTVFGIEVKAAENLRSKSLAAFHDKFPATKALRFSLSDWRDQEWMRNIPLYAMHNMRYWTDAGVSPR